MENDPQMGAGQHRQHRPSNGGHAHLVGVAGVGMNPLAQALVATGWDVSGSDRYLDIGHELDVIPKLRKAGVRLVSQDGSGVGHDTQAVVVSTAIEADNPDIAAATRHRVPVRHRAEMLAALAQDKHCVAITGTSGKTTVTGMVGWLLEQLGADPTVVNGGIVVNWETPERVGNVRVGRSDLWVVEADESDRSLLRFRPDHAILTNISADHFGLAETHALFDQFATQVRHDIVGPWDDATEPWHSFAPDLSADGSRFAYRGQEFRIPLLGRHNAHNALQAVMLCERLGHPLDRIAAALATFRGIRRRLDIAGTAHDITVIDDYGHNPAKIRAAWHTVAPHARRVHAVWRPHGFGPLAKMFDDLTALFREMAGSCERVYVLPVYYVGGTATASLTADALVAPLAADGLPVELAPDYDTLIARLVGTARPGDTILIMGARDPDLPALARRLVAAL